MKKNIRRTGLLTLAVFALALVMPGAEKAVYVADAEISTIE